MKDHIKSCLVIKKNARERTSQGTTKRKKNNRRLKRNFVCILKHKREVNALIFVVVDITEKKEMCSQHTHTHTQWVCIQQTGRLALFSRVWLVVLFAFTSNIISLTFKRTEFCGSYVLNITSGV